MRIFLLGRNQELSAYRIQALEAEGFTVHAPDSKREAVQTIVAGAYDVAVLSYSLSNDTTTEFAELLRQSCSNCPVVVISETGWDDTKIDPDEVVIGSKGPRALIEAVRRATTKKICRVK